MCGIAGVFSKKLSPDSKEYLLIKMLSRISYRGPDESGIIIDDEIGLGSVRLSIIDLRTGHQPMCTYDSKLWIVYNGEIFNYPELRQELIVRGRTFRTRSDTEIVLQLYDEFGEDCLHKLNGQFSFAIWNSQTKELFMARDRIGIRPLYYYFKNGILVFASEIKSILEYENYTPEIYVKALTQVYSLWTSLTPGTMFKDIQELSPGSYLKFHHGELKVYNYWNLSFRSEEVLSFEDTVCNFELLLKDAVSLRLRSDVTVAAYLSGGLDSSSLTAIIKDQVPDMLQTYSIGFNDDAFDETPYQNQVSSFLNTSHHSFYCSSQDVSCIFPTIIWHTEIPLVRTAPAPMYLLSREVRKQNIKVVITGEGADEILAGYDIFKEALIKEFWARQPHSQIRPLLLKKLYPYIPHLADMDARVLKFIFGFKLEDVKDPFYSHQLRWHNTMAIRRYFSEDIQTQINGYDPLEDVMKMLPPDFLKYDTLEKAQWLESTILLSGYLLSSQGDRMAMANSVEGRYPFLDYRVIEFCSSLPARYKLNGLNEKFLLKKLMKGKLPESIIKRPKQAYRAPTVASFLNNSSDYMHDLLSKESFSRINIFDFEKVKPLFEKLKNPHLISETDVMAFTGIISGHLFSEIFIHSNINYKPMLRTINPSIYQKHLRYEQKSNF